MLSAGHLLDSRYRLDERIATGGMGDVWRGTDTVLGRVVAVKVLRPAMLTDPEFAARFYGEARMMAAFRHPGVVEVYDYNSGQDGEDQCAYLVMAYVEGEPLSTRLKEAGRLPVAETMSIVAQAAEALHAAHQHGTVHRDVKPGNLIVKPNGTVILVDFGVARSAAVTSVTGLNAIVGTALYMAPEQVTKGNVTPATDIYALGAVAYHCISGSPPFDGDNALQVALRHLEDEPEPLPAEVPVAVRQLITRAMAKHPEDRFAGADEFAAAALAATGPMDYQTLSGTALTAPLSPAPPTSAVPVPRGLPLSGTPARKRTSRGELIARLAVAGAFLVAIGLALALVFAPDDNKPTVPVTVPTSQIAEIPATEEPFSAEPTLPTFRPTQRPNGQPVRPTSAAPSVTPTASATSARPTVAPTPTRTPTLEPATTTPPPATTPAATPTTTPPGDDNGGDGAGTTGG